MYTKTWILLEICPSDAVWLHHHSFSRIFWWQTQNNSDAE